MVEHAVKLDDRRLLVVVTVVLVASLLLVSVIGIWMVSRLSTAPQEVLEKVIKVEEKVDALSSEVSRMRAEMNPEGDD